MKTQCNPAVNCPVGGQMMPSVLKILFQQPLRMVEPTLPFVQLMTNLGGLHCDLSTKEGCLHLVRYQLLLQYIEETQT